MKEIVQALRRRSDPQYLIQPPGGVVLFVPERLARQYAELVTLEEAERREQERLAWWC